MTTIEDRLRRLEDEREILDTLYAYGHAMDYGDEATFMNCWTDDAVFDLPWRSGPYRGHDGIRNAFREHTHAPEYLHKHLLAEPRIRVVGDMAEVESMFARLDRYGGVPKIRSFGRYIDRLVRCVDGSWRFSYRKAEGEAVRLTPPDREAASAMIDERSEKS